MPIQQAPWWAVAGTLECPVCLVLADRPGIPLQKSARLHSKLDGYAIFSFRCEECGWKSEDLLVKIDSEAPASQEPKADEAPAIAIPTEEEIQVISAKPKPLESKIVDLLPPDPVPTEDLVKFVIENSPNELKMVDGRKLRRKIEKSEQEAMQGQPVGIVRLIYSDGNSPRPGAFEFKGEAVFMSLAGFPDMAVAMKKIQASFAGDLKLLTEHPQRAPVIPPKFNKMGSRVKGVCGCEGSESCTHIGVCGAAPGECQCPGRLKMRNPSAMKPQAWALECPDGTPVMTLQKQLEQEAANPNSVF